MKRDLIYPLFSFLLLAAMACSVSQAQVHRKAPVNMHQEAAMPPSTDYF